MSDVAKVQCKFAGRVLQCRLPRADTIFMEVKEALLLQEALDINASFMLLYEPMLCDNALDQG